MSTWAEYFASDPSPEQLAFDLEVWYAGIRGRVKPPLVRYNPYFETELQARAAWGVYRLLTKQPDTKFPDDRVPKTYEGRPDGLQIFRERDNR